MTAPVEKKVNPAAASAAAAAGPGLWLKDLRFFSYDHTTGNYSVRPSSDIPDELLTEELEAALSGSTTAATATATATAFAPKASAAAANPKPTPAATKPNPSSSPSNDRKNQLIHADSFVPDSPQSVPCHAMMRVLLYMVVPEIAKIPVTARKGVYIKCRENAHTLTFINQLNGKSADFDRIAKGESVVLFCPLSIEFDAARETQTVATDSKGKVIYEGDGKTPKMRASQLGNHYVSVIIDSRPLMRTLSGGGGMIYYWDPKGKPLKNVDIRAALKRKFGTFRIYDDPVYTQECGHQCAVWLVVFIRAYIEYIIMTAERKFHPVTKKELPVPVFDIRLQSNDKFADLRNGSTLVASKKNAEFIEWCRKIIQTQTKTIHDDECFKPLLD